MSSQPAVLAALASPRRCEILRLVWNHELTADPLIPLLPQNTVVGQVWPQEP